MQPPASAPRGSASYTRAKHGVTLGSSGAAPGGALGGLRWRWERSWLSWENRALKEPGKLLWDFLFHPWVLGCLVHRADAREGCEVCWGASDAGSNTHGGTQGRPSGWVSLGVSGSSGARPVPGQ